MTECICKWRRSNYPSDIDPMTRIPNPDCEAHAPEPHWPRSHDWTGPRGHMVHVHCAACGKIFEINKDKGVCFGPPATTGDGLGNRRK